MARAIWSGSISFGLVSIPVKLYSATDPQDVQFHQLQKNTGQRVRNKRVAEESGREVDYEDIVKGYEVSKGEYVIVTPEELESVEPTRSKSIEIEDFVDLDDIDPIYFEKTYYLAPEKGAGAEKAYALLREALSKSNKIAVGRFVLRTKEYLAAIRPMDDVLVLETMYFADEIRDAKKEIKELPAKAAVSKRELDMAMQLVESQAGDWDPMKYEDRYRASVLKLIRAKAKGKDIVVEKEAEPERVSDLMEALRQSVESARQRTSSGGSSASKRTTARTTKKSTAKTTKKSTAKRTRRTKAA
jgi:DNA end-binding protein Ku